MKRRTVDVAFAVGGAVFSVLLLVLGLVLKDQADFAETYVHDQLAEQEITFSPMLNEDGDPMNADDIKAAQEEFNGVLLEKLGTQEAVEAFIVKYGVTAEVDSKCLNEYKGEMLLTGKQAECYANDFIRLHALESSIVSGTGLEIKDPADPTKMISADGRSYTYATISPVISAAKAVVADLKDNGGSEEDIAAAEKQVATLNSLRVDTLLRAQTLRGLLLTTYGFSIFGEKADLAATVCYLAAAVLFLLSILGLLHAFFSKHAKDVILAVEHPAPAAELK